MKKRLSIFLFLCFCFGTEQILENQKVINRPFVESNSINYAINEDNKNESMFLVQFNFSSDSLIQIANDNFPELGLGLSPASYQRIVPSSIFDRVSNVFLDQDYVIIDEDYRAPTDSRLYWVELKNGSDTYGTQTDDDAVSYTCDCLDGANDCVKLGWYAWYNPLDYWGEAWWAFDPPEHTYINEIRVTVRGGQCDLLPLDSETYMGMMDASGNWSQDYQLSVDYTDNLFIVDETWNGEMLMPRIGSEDNYVIDTIQLQFFYTCLDPDPVSYVVSSDAYYCNYVNISWDNPEDESIESINVYRDGSLLTSLPPDSDNYIDYGAVAGQVHDYCIETTNSCGTSSIFCNDGSIKDPAYIVGNVNASDGEFIDQIVIDWDPSSNADSYKLYRDGIWLGLAQSDSELLYVDEFADLYTEHEYCIESENECGLSEFLCDTGYLSYGIGDINFDSSIDVLDVVLVVNIILGLSEVNDETLWAGDINNDDMINIQDVILLISIILN